MSAKKQSRSAGRQNGSQEQAKTGVLASDYNTTEVNE